MCFLLTPWKVARSQSLKWAKDVRPGWDLGGACRLAWHNDPVLRCVLTQVAVARPAVGAHSGTGGVDHATDERPERGLGRAGAEGG